MSGSLKSNDNWRRVLFLFGSEHGGGLHTKWRGVFTQVGEDRARILRPSYDWSCRTGRNEVAWFLRESPPRGGLRATIGFQHRTKVRKRNELARGIKARRSRRRRQI